MKRLYFGSFLCCSLMACGSGSGGGSDESEQTFGPQPVDLAYSGSYSILMGQAGVFYNMAPKCSPDGQFVYDTSGATTYTIDQGKLYLLDKGDCLASVLQGEASGIEGEWTASGEFLAMPGTSPNENTCDNPNSWDYKIVGTMEFTATEVHYKMAIQDFCWAELSVHVNKESGDSLSMVTCDSLVWMRNGKQATLKLISFAVGEGGNSTVYRLDYQGASCTRHKAAYRMPSPETCAQAYQLYLAQNGQASFEYWYYPEVYIADQADQAAYNACVEAAGFSVSGYEPGQ